MQRAGADDKPLRMVKTVLHELVKLRGTSIKGHLSMVPIDMQPPPIILAYIDLNLQVVIFHHSFVLLELSPMHFSNWSYLDRHWQLQECWLPLYPARIIGVILLQTIPHLQPIPLMHNWRYYFVHLCCLLIAYATFYSFFIFLCLDIRVFSFFYMLSVFCNYSKTISVALYTPCS